MSASAGGTSIPGPATLSVDDADVVQMWRAVQRQRFGIGHPGQLVTGVGLIVIACTSLSMPEHPHFTWLSLGLGIGWAVVSFSKTGKRDGALRPTYLAFDDNGVVVDVTFSPPAGRRYEWCEIRRIDDVGGSFVIVPRFDKRIVVPKRAFADRGAQAWSFFGAHGVAGRVSPALAGTYG